MLVALIPEDVLYFLNITNKIIVFFEKITAGNMGTLLFVQFSVSG